MKRIKQGLSYMLIICMVVSLFNMVVMAAEDEVVKLSDDSLYQGTVFGDVGGQNKITTDNFLIQEEGDTVHMAAMNNRGKISGSTEGLAYYYQQIDTEQDFSLSATATVVDSDKNNQVSFGIMYRDTILVNTNEKDVFGNSIALGPINVAKDTPNMAFMRDADGLVKVGELALGNGPAMGKSYSMTLTKEGDYITLSLNDQKPVVVADVTEGDNRYIGLFVSRNASVDFTNVTYTALDAAVSNVTVNTSDVNVAPLQGEALNEEGFVVTAEMEDGTTEAVTDYVVQGYDPQTVGEQTVSVYAKGFKVDVTVDVQALTLTDVDVMNYPVVDTYHVGDTVTTEGLSVAGIYNDGFATMTLPTEAYHVLFDDVLIEDAPIVIDTAGKHVLTIQAVADSSIHTDINYTVSASSLSSLDIERSFASTSYFVGDTFSTKGLLLKAVFADETTRFLTADEVMLEAPNMEQAGTVNVSVNYLGKSVAIPVVIANPAVTGLALETYPQTTYTIGEELDLSTMVVQKAYDNGDRVTLTADDYTVDTSQVDVTTAGVYTVVVKTVDSEGLTLELPVTVQEVVDYEWKFIAFGQSTKEGNNTYELADDNTLTVSTVEGAGKVTADHDGISYYYTEIDSATTNFELSADIEVVEYAKSPYDGQESFGIMARDTIGEDGNSSVFSSNIAAIGGFSGGTKSPNGTQFFTRHGVTATNGTGSEGITTFMLDETMPESDTTYPSTTYHLTLRKTNSGYEGQLNDGEVAKDLLPEELTVLDDKVYVGFYTGRVATIKVHNWSFTTSQTATDQPAEPIMPTPVEPVLRVDSYHHVSTATPDLTTYTNVPGLLTIMQGDTMIVSEMRLEEAVSTHTSLDLKEGDTAVTIKFQPDEMANVSTATPLYATQTLTYKTYDAETLYVAPEGDEANPGTMEAPLSLQAAIDYLQPGQTIVMLDGTYKMTEPLLFAKGNNGTASKVKSLVAQEGTRPIVDLQKAVASTRLSGDYWVVRGIDFANSLDNTTGFIVGGNHNTIDNCRFYNNGDTGMQISRTDGATTIDEWPSYNLILNCESFDNRDSSENNADGFAAKLTVGVGNVFDGCIAHNNIDDGWDLYTKVGTGAIGAVTIKNSVAYNNGTLTGGHEGDGDKNGFKLGGEGVHVPHVIENSIAYGNGAYGFTSNSNPGIVARDNIAFNNVRGNIAFTTYDAIEEDFTIEGFLSYQRDEDGKDMYPEDQVSDDNYFFDGEQSVNASGDVLQADDFKHLIIPPHVYRLADGTPFMAGFLEPVEQ